MYIYRCIPCCSSSSCVVLTRSERGFLELKHVSTSEEPASLELKPLVFAPPERERGGGLFVGLLHALPLSKDV
jgi:hypothetical protein